MVVVTVMAVCMLMVVWMANIEQQCANQIDQQRNGGDADRFVEMNRQRIKEAIDRLAGHEKRSLGRHARQGKSERKAVNSKTLRA